MKPADSTGKPVQMPRYAGFEPLLEQLPRERFFVRYPAKPPLKGYVLYVHPFAEELNRSRRIAGMQARRLAEAGFEVLQLDLYGCGDSPGEFKDATWQQWLDDTHAAARRLQSIADGRAPVWIWGLRLGCLIATEAVRTLEGPLNLLFWQPMLNGQFQIQQLLRLVSAGELLARQNSEEAASLRQRIAQGEDIELGGYELSRGLLAGLKQVTLKPPGSSDSCKLGRVVWIEITNAGALASMSSVTIQACQTWIEAGAELQYRQVIGPAFWQLLETEDAPQLLDASVEALQSAPTSDHWVT